MEGEREEEKQQWVVASHSLHAGDLVHNPGMCPDQKLNWLPFGLQAGTQSTEPHQPGHIYLFLINISLIIFLYIYFSSYWSTSSKKLLKEVYI